MTIIVAGDSWGLGEWYNDSNGTGIAHPGLAGFLQDDGHDVVNLSVPGSGNWATYKRLSYFYDFSNTNQLLRKPVTQILIFQSEWIRDYNHYWPDWSDSNPDRLIVSYNIPKFTASLRDDNLNRWYLKLSQLSIRHSIPIGLVGGCSDVKAEPGSGLDVVCQSLTNLCLHNDSSIEDPVYCFNIYTKFVEEARRTADSDAVAFLINEIECAKQREQLWKTNPEWFWPDGWHANRNAHEKLYHHLKDNKWIY